ncbi:cytochrome P450 [Rickenella mellea]|uniref:Cytochrome P450 n=1 Tax=Rickenella mellea TaxID=50990 RepID=A0A4Y7Q9N4_9AGAM|nr:cytochrome P450 [Rickenella mellea]
MFFAASLALPLVWFIARFIVNRKRSDIRYAPGPSAKSASWIWGHELEAFRGQALEVYSKWMYTYGPLFKINAAFFHNDIIVVGDHAAVQHIFADIFTYMKGPSLRPITANIVGKGVLWAEGEDHVFQRRLLSPAFTLESVKKMADVISECAEKVQCLFTWLEWKFDQGKTFAGFLGPVVIRAFPSIVSLSLKSQNNTAGLSTAQIIDNISTFIMAGHETTGGALNFALMELARSSRVQQKLRREVQQFRDALSYDAIQKLEYLDAVTKEVLRLHPSVPHTERVAMRDDIIPLATPIRMRNGTVLTSFKVQKGQVFHIPLMTMNTNPKVWGEDAGEFQPERWLTPNAIRPSNELPHGWSNMVTFTDGPRLCIGYRLALFEFKVILATLSRSLEFHSTDATVNRKDILTLQPVVDGKCGVLPLRLTLASHT